MNIFFVILHNFQFNSTFFKKKVLDITSCIPELTVKIFLMGKKSALSSTLSFIHAVRYLNRGFSDFSFLVI